jgi:hypothetical protein
VHALQVEVLVDVLEELEAHDAVVCAFVSLDCAATL